jgi:hypothetical protein
MANTYAPLLSVVPSSGPIIGRRCLMSIQWGNLMQDAEYDLRRIPLPRTSVNKPSFGTFGQNSSAIHRRPLRLVVMRQEKSLQEEAMDGGACSGIAQGSRYSD